VKDDEWLVPMVLHNSSGTLSPLWGTISSYEHPPILDVYSFVRPRKAAIPGSNPPQTKQHVRPMLRESCSFGTRAAVKASGALCLLTD